MTQHIHQVTKEEYMERQEWSTGEASVSPTMVLAIDPGPEKSAYVLWDGAKIHEMAILDNDDILDFLHAVNTGLLASPCVLAVEMIASYGMPVGKSVFETCVWIGRFVQEWDRKFSFVYRKDVKMHLCNSNRAKDGNIRQALIDLYGIPGTKKNPGILYGVKKDIWAALAVAVTYLDSPLSTS